jgi:hypothetical protein
MEKSVEDVCNGVVSSNCTRTVSAADGVVSVGVTVGRAGGAVRASVGARSWFQNNIVHPSADADVEDGIRHIVARG